MTYLVQRKKGDGKLKRKESPVPKEKNQRENEHINKGETTETLEQGTQKFKKLTFASVPFSSLCQVHIASQKNRPFLENFY